MSFFRFRHFSRRAINQYTPCSFLGLIFFIAYYRLQVREWYSYILSSLFPQLILSFIPEITNEDYLSFRSTSMHINYERH